MGQGGSCVDGAHVAGVAGYAATDKLIEESCMSADSTTNVLYNEQAMAILADACTRLRALGLHCGLGPDALFPDSAMSAVLRVSTSVQSIDEGIVGGLIASDYALSQTGRKVFDDRLAEYLSECAIGKAKSGADAAR